MKKIFLVLIAAVLLISCKEESPVAPEENNPAPIGSFYPKSGSIQIKSEDLGKISSMNSGSITFFDNSVVKNLKPGNFIFSDGKNLKSPKGFLRKVNSISGNTLNTAYASLDEAFEKGDLNFTLYSSSLENIGKSGSSEGGVFSLKTTIYDKDKNYATLEDQLKIDGSIKLNGNVTGGIKFPPMKITSKFNMTIDIDLDLIATGALTYGIKANLLSVKGTPVIVSGVVLTPEFSVDFTPSVSVQGGAKFGIKDKITLNSSIIFENGWSFTEGFQNVFSGKPVDAVLKGTLKGTLSFKFSVAIYELTSIGLSMGPYAELNIEPLQNPWWTLSAGLSGSLFVETKPITGLTLGYSKSLFDSKKIIAQAQGSQGNNPPSAPKNPSPTNAAQNVNSPVIVSWNCSDPDGDPLHYDLIAGINFENPVRFKNIQTTSYNLGSFTGNKQVFWKVVAFDSNGDSTHGPLWSFWTGSSAVNTLVLQPGPNDGKDIWLRHMWYSNGTHDYYRYPDRDTLRVSYDNPGWLEESESLIEFNLSEVPSNSEIVSAKLKLYGSGTINYVGHYPKVSLGKLLSYWTKSTVTWTTKPSSSFIIEKELIYEGTLSWYEFDVTSVVQEWANGEPNYGFGLTAPQNESKSHFRTSRSINLQYRPILEIVYR